MSLAVVMMRNAAHTSDTKSFLGFVPGGAADPSADPHLRLWPGMRLSALPSAVARDTY